MLMRLIGINEDDEHGLAQFNIRDRYMAGLRNRLREDHFGDDSDSIEDMLLRDRQRMDFEELERIPHLPYLPPSRIRRLGPELEEGPPPKTLTNAEYKDKAVEVLKSLNGLIFGSQILKLNLRVPKVIDLILLASTLPELADTFPGCFRVLSNEFTSICQETI